MHCLRKDVGSNAYDGRFSTAFGFIVNDSGEPKRSDQLISTRHVALMCFRCVIFPLMAIVLEDGYELL